MCAQATVSQPHCCVFSFGFFPILLPVYLISFFFFFLETHRLLQALKEEVSVIKQIGPVKYDLSLNVSDIFCPQFFFFSYKRMIYLRVLPVCSCVNFFISQYGKHTKWVQIAAVWTRARCFWPSPLLILPLCLSTQLFCALEDIIRTVFFIAVGTLNLWTFFCIRTTPVRWSLHKHTSAKEQGQRGSSGEPAMSLVWGFSDLQYVMCSWGLGLMFSPFLPYII